MAPACASAAPCAIGKVPERLPTDPLLEPVVRVRLVVEGVDLDVAGRAVERDRLRQIAIRLEPNGPDALPAGQLLKLAQEPAADPEAAGLGRDPHPLQLGGPTPVQLQRAAAEGLPMQEPDGEEAGRQPQL